MAPGRVPIHPINAPGLVPLPLLYRRALLGSFGAEDALSPMRGVVRPTSVLLIGKHDPTPKMRRRLLY